MNANEYQALALRTANYELEPKIALAVAGLGLVGEAGEVSEHIKKHLGHGRELDKEKVIKEIGDVLWYTALVCHLMGTDMGEVMTANINKLKERWPDGFDVKSKYAAGDV